MLTLNSFFHAVRYALDKLEYEDIFLKVKQYQVLASLEKCDTVAILPTAYGKSIIFHLFPFVYDHINASTSSHGHGCAVLIVTPLNSLISNQTSILKKRGFEAAVLTTTITSSESCTKSENNASESESDNEEAPETQSLRLSTDKKTKENIEKENFKIIFAPPPEAFISCREGRRVLMYNSLQQRVVASVIDEAHLVEERGREFHPDFRKLAQLGSIFPNAPFLVLTATAPAQMREELICTLHLEKPLVAVANLNRPNIFIEKKRGNQHLLMMKALNLYCFQLQKN
jgi:superfamily II DNA helicase RecQ